MQDWNIEFLLRCASEYGSPESSVKLLSSNSAIFGYPNISITNVERNDESILSVDFSLLNPMWAALVFGEKCKYLEMKRTSNVPLLLRRISISLEEFSAVLNRHLMIQKMTRYLFGPKPYVLYSNGQMGINLALMDELYRAQSMYQNELSRLYSRLEEMKRFYEERLMLGSSFDNSGGLFNHALAARSPHDIQAALFVCSARIDLQEFTVESKHGDQEAEEPEQMAARTAELVKFVELPASDDD